MKQLKKKRNLLKKISYFYSKTHWRKKKSIARQKVKLPAEVHTYFFQMDENSERFRRDVEQLDQIQEERSKAQWEYDNEIDASLIKIRKKISKAVFTDFSWIQDDAVSAPLSVAVEPWSVQQMNWCL